MNKTVQINFAGRSDGCQARANGFWFLHTENFTVPLRSAGIDPFSSVAKKDCIKRTYASRIAAVGCTESLAGIHSYPVRNLKSNILVEIVRCFIRRWHSFSPAAGEAACTHSPKNARSLPCRSGADTESSISC
ncbi:hypothetical protein SBA2_590023 [Acidobacteriia bacterium SbA2]|nr:hypothetical protein SBA2_590023 [Acidobacteriia bacterium SbA2]